VPAEHQLVLELFVREIGRSRAFYQQLGFGVAEDRGTFVVLTWEGHHLLLDQRTELPDPPAFTRANVRILVSDVDARWQRAQAMGARVITPIADREYGLRDFTIADPDGFGVRFGSYLRDADRPSVPAR
jgi:uncharacterized glyoxalase superfamily protein PhnB